MCPPVATASGLCDAKHGKWGSDPRNRYRHEAAAATDSLRFIFYGVAITLPVILFYSAYVFWVFRGKATDLSYE